LIVGLLWSAPQDTQPPTGDGTAPAKVDPGVPAEAPVDAELPAQVRKLVKELDHAEKARRDAAQRKLIELGAKVLDLLPESTDKTPAEVRMRLDKVRSELEKTQAESAVESTTITLAGDEIPLSRLLAEFEKQTGNKLEDTRQEFRDDDDEKNAAEPTFKLAFDKMPFWPALDQALDQAQMTTYPYRTENGALGLIGRASSQLDRHGHAFYVGSFRVEAKEFFARRDLRDPEGRLLQLTLEAAWEPRVQPIVVVQPFDAIAAFDENGEPVPTSVEVSQLEFAPESADAVNVELPIQFKLPSRGVNRIASLKGKLMAVMPGRVENFRFTDLEKGKKQERRNASVIVTVDEVRKNQAIWQVRVRVRFDKASGALESHRGDWVTNNVAFMEGPDKEQIPHAGYHTPNTANAENEVSVVYLFDLPDGLKGHAFVYRTATAIVSVPIEYELKDLELP
ncbi:MAG TPA: hypothetical protein VGX76_24510, partial [Pirellulales bacterium]|jgi:hypothetical protein|nr:hypothetical protein [Pirellulales bacterium]